MVGAVAHALNIAPGADGRGTAVTTVFGPVPPPAASPGVEMLCGLALETVADVSNVDLVHEGVLRRVAAEVANDPALTAWLRAAVPRRSPARQRGRRRATAARAWSSPTPPSRARPAGPGSASTLCGGSRSHSRNRTEHQRQSGASGAARVDIRYRARRSSASSPTRHTMTSRSPPGAPCCAVGWRRLDCDLPPRMAWICLVRLTS